MKLHLTPRLGYLAGFLICGGLILYALYLQYYEYQDPCPLCLLQRVVYIALMVVFLLGALHGPRRTGAVVYSTLLVLVSLIGAGIAGRHVWLQHLPPEQVPACGPGLSYMIESLPNWLAVVKKVLAGSGECAEVNWTLFGFSMPEWTLLCFLLLAIGALVTGFRRRV